MTHGLPPRHHGQPPGSSTRSPGAPARLGAGRLRRLLLALAAALALLAAGCGGGEGPSTQEADRATTSSTEVPPATETTTSAAAGSPPSIGTSSARLEDQTQPPIVAPTSLTVEAIGVEAAIEGVGVDADGRFDVPAASLVGWYRFGPSPGRAGSAVLAGHVDFAGERGVFFDLDRLTPGTEVVVGYDDGSARSFTVTEVQRHAKDSLPEELFARGGPPSLALITCGGEFDRERRSYRDNVVALAVPTT